MDTAAAIELVERIGAVPDSCPDRDVVLAGTRDLCRLRSWLDGRELSFTRSLTALSSFPEKDLADASKTSLGEGLKLTERAVAAEAFPEVAEAVSSGETTGRHLDVVRAVLRDLTPDQQTRLAEYSERLAEWARSLPDDRFRAKVRALVR